MGSLYNVIACTIWGLIKTRYIIKQKGKKDFKRNDTKCNKNNNNNNKGNHDSERRSRKSINITQLIIVKRLTQLPVETKGGNKNTVPQKKGPGQV